MHRPTFSQTGQALTDEGGRARPTGASGGAGAGAAIVGHCTAASAAASGTSRSLSGWAAAAELAGSWCAAAALIRRHRHSHDDCFLQCVAHCCADANGHWQQSDLAHSGCERRHPCSYQVPWSPPGSCTGHIAVCIGVLPHWNPSASHQNCLKNQLQRTVVERADADHLLLDLTA